MQVENSYTPKGLLMRAVQKNIVKCKKLSLIVWVKKIYTKICVLIVWYSSMLSTHKTLFGLFWWNALSL